ncbi:transketolase [Eubacterium coprostanoligenes]|uniref:Transketolase n=1 Tax=Eubacterium coprostanoligenes TaxID=290054 RepID=A0A1T4L1D7_9FIRM|nr:transketolase [Eubacterium coprostanoligenes]MCI6353838.1 transketolase [Eubacterium coprostanoligenes]MCI7265183.1 transketolase [Eubacterium coprostanoligenes]MDD6665913.1 transketolase [Eubacterium coprostanoligenes]SJZ48401.1 transketolase [Eubacterium coprostanoligenes]
MDSLCKKELEIYATKIRMGIIEGTYNAKAGHPGGSLSAADVFAYLYEKEMRVNPKEPKWDDRDRLVLSKGHCAPGLYAALAYKGFFPVEDLKTLRHIDSYLQGHPNMNTVPGIDMSTGSLGQGISVAVGMAKGAKFLGKDVNVYSVLGDGEIEEGQVWEAMMFAHQYKLDNLCIIIDCNGLQIDGPCSEVMSAEPIDEKVKAFGFDVITIDGNDFDDLEKAFDAFHKSNKPFAIIMKTVKGKGVSYMENQVGWHGKAPNEEEYNIAMAELNAKLAELEA